MDINTVRNSLKKFISVCPQHGETEFMQIMDFPPKCCQCSVIDQKREQQRQSEQAQRERMLAAMANCGINPIANGFDAWVYDASQAERQARIIKNLGVYIKSFDHSKPNILLYGSTGAGKTMLANALARAVFKNQYNQGSYKPAKLIRSAEITRLCKEHWTDKTKPTEQMILGELKAFDLLVIDDLGDGDTTGNVANDRSRLGDLIDGRYLQKPTVITTNMDVDQVKIFMGDRAWDRFQQNLIMIKCDWASYRQKAGVAMLGEW